MASCKLQAPSSKLQAPSLKLHGYRGTRLHGHTATGLHGYTATWLHGCKVAWQHGYAATMLQGYRATRLQGHGCRATWLNGHAAARRGAKPVRADVGQKLNRTSICIVASKAFGNACRPVNFSRSPGASGTRLGWNLRAFNFRGARPHGHTAEAAKPGRADLGQKFKERRSAVLQPRYSEGHVAE